MRLALPSGLGRSMTLLALALATNGTAFAALPQGKVAPAWSGKTVEGKPITSAQFKGKVVVMNFFGFTCSPCHEEYPFLQVMQKKYGPKGFTIISVSGDQKLNEASAFAKEVRATFPVVHDPKIVVFDKFQVEPLPTNFVIGPDGKVLFSQEGADVKALEAAVVKALGGESSPAKKVVKVGRK